MSANLLRAVVRHLRDRPAGGDPSADGELLRRFARLRDAAAFEALVGRHGPMVWGVCRRAVRTHADAEDAYQVTFAVLAARAGSVRNPDAVGCWLYGVAARVARRVRATSARFAAVEEPADAPGPAAPPPDRLAARECVAALDEELARLPQKYRGPLVLCYLQERTQDEAAGQLGVSLSTLKRRLEAGRQLLRGRLERRGVELSAVLAAASVAGLAPAGLPAATVAAVIGGVSGPVGAITREVLFAMWMTKVRTWAAGLVAAAGLTGGAGHYAATVYGQAEGAGYGRAAPAGEADRPAARKQPAKTPPAPPEPRALPGGAPPPPAPAAPVPPPAPAQVAGDPKEQARAAATRAKLAELELQLAEVQVAEAKVRLEAARAEGTAVEKATAESALKRALIEVEKSKVSLDAEQQSLKRLEQRTEAPPAAPPPPLPPGMVPVAIPATGGTASVTPAVMPPEVRKLREEQLKAAEDTYRLEIGRMRAGAMIGEQVVEVVLWSQRIRDAQTALDPSAWAKAAAEHLDRVREVEVYIKNRVEIGQDRPQSARAIAYFRLGAEIAVQQAETRRAVPSAGGAGRATPNAPTRGPASAAPRR